MASFDFNAYMKQVAISSVQIGHVEDDIKKKRFFRVSSIQALEELINSLYNVDENILAIEDNREGDLFETNGQYVGDSKLCSFFVLRKAKVMNPDSREENLSACESVAKKILSKIRHDYLTDNALETQHGLMGLDMNSIHYFSFGPVLNNCFGVHCAFTVDHDADIKYNQNDWS